MSHQQRVYLITLVGFFLLVLIFWGFDPDSYVGDVSGTLVYAEIPSGANASNVPNEAMSAPRAARTGPASQAGNKTTSKPMVLPKPVSATVKIPLPPTSPYKSCSPKQLSYIQLSLSGSKTLRWMTNCPDATWAFDKTPNIHEDKNPQGWPIFHEPSNGRKPLSIFVGCNKGMDAVSTLRQLSRNATYDKKVWREIMKIEDSACNQHMSPQIALLESSPSREATVYCIEAMPSTMKRLQESITQLQWGHSLRIFQAAMSQEDGSVLFPNARVGTEELGIAHCKLKRISRDCEEVPQYRLDTFMEKHALPEDAHATIDFLSVDVEGFDWLVLEGASNALDRTNYLEFEYNSVGPWLHQNLSTAIRYLSQTKGFTCYWAGVSGKLWRITGCWIDIWDTWKQWSNIACAHSVRAPTLAAKMEERFQKTLVSKGYRED